MKRFIAILVVVAGLCALPAAALAAPVLEIDAHHGPSNFQPGGTGEYTFLVNNIGDEPTSGPITLEINLPPGTVTRDQLSFLGTFTTWNTQFFNSIWSCPSSAAGETSITCTFNSEELVQGTGAARRLTVFVDVAPNATGPLAAEATVSNAGVGSVTVLEPAPVGPPAQFGIEAESLVADAFDREAQPVRQAGAHPYRVVTGFDFNRVNTFQKFSSGSSEVEVPAVVPAETFRLAEAVLPRGLIGNPEAAITCKTTDFYGDSCPTESQVGTAKVTFASLLGGAELPVSETYPIFRVEAPVGSLAAFAFVIAGRPAYLLASLDPEDYSVVTTVANVSDILPVHFQRLTFWGVPGDPSHDPERWDPATRGWGVPFEGPSRPFLSLPTECNVFDTTDIARLNSWLRPTVNPGPYSSEPIAVNGCNQLGFESTIEVRPTTNVADAPTGLEFDLHLPQNEDPDGLATAHLRDAVVKLPAGMTVNPPSADGLGACSMAQVGIGADGVPNGNPVSCPDASKLGTVETVSPALDHPLKGTVFLAEQNANPFGSLLAMYIVIEDPETGLLVKLPGRVDPDPSTGQLTASFKNNPQLPVEDLRLAFFQGPRAALKTPAGCGTHTTSGTMTPWSSPEGADVPVASSFELTQGPAGGACLGGGAGAPNNPSFTAGTLDPTAKAFTPFSLKLSRADGTQQLKAIDTTLPKGLLGKLAGTTYCSDSALSSAAGKSGRDERSAASCPASSRVGSVTVGAGAGSTPLYVGGTAYLAGPYKGAPLSLAIVTPAVAGPFDLGTVVVRTALNVNPESAQIHAVSDELPTILQGIPLNIRSVALKMDRPDFTLNPTSCDPTKVEGSALSIFNQSASLSSPFQVGECNKLGFKPTLALKLKGGTKRSDFPALTATLTARPGDANIGRAVVALPRSEFLAQNHIKTICTRVQYAADQCPAGSIYGKATAWSPLLDQPLSGNVYLRSSPNPLPDLVVALEGQIDVDLVGRIDSFKKGIRTTFDTVPDAPVSKFVLEMQGGKKGLLVNSRNLCKTTNKATVEMTGQNGVAYDSTSVLQSKCKKPKAKKKPAKKHGAKKKG